MLMPPGFCVCRCLAAGSFSAPPRAGLHGGGRRGAVQATEEDMPDAVVDAAMSLELDRDEYVQVWPLSTHPTAPHPGAKT